MKVIIDMAKLKIPFQFSCSAHVGKDDPRAFQNGRDDGQALANAVPLFKTNKQESIRIMAKYTRGAAPEVLEGAGQRTRSFSKRICIPLSRG